MILSIALMFAGVSALCLLLYLGAVYALPAAVGFWAGICALHSDAGIGSVAVGLIAGAFAFALGQLLLGTVRSPAIRWAVLLAFIAPAVYAGYSVVLQLAEIAIPSPIWRHLFAVVGAIVIGCTAVARLAVPSPAPRLPKRFGTVAIPKRSRSMGMQKTMLSPE